MDFREEVKADKELVVKVPRFLFPWNCPGARWGRITLSLQTSPAESATHASPLQKAMEWSYWAVRALHARMLRPDRRVFCGDPQSRTGLIEFRADKT